LKLAAHNIPTSVVVDDRQELLPGRGGGPLWLVHAELAYVAAGFAHGTRHDVLPLNDGLAGGGVGVGGG
jgi:hypothetical protein